MGGLRIGKVRGLQQISTRDGIFTMCAMDHRGSLKKMINPGDPQSLSYEQMAEWKRHLCAALAPFSSAVLLDPNYGAAEAVLSGDLPGQTGLLISMEATGYSGGAEGRITELLSEWGAEKIKRMGGSAGKLLLYFRPDLHEVASKQVDVVKQAASDCDDSDLSFLLEPKTYAVGDEMENPESLASKLPDLVIETARQLTALNIDVLKAEFPADMKYEKDEGRLLDLCQQLTEASKVPWVVLSAGVTYEVFARQVEIACRAGASGFLGGRAVWQEATRVESVAERDRYLATTVVDRLKRLSEIAAKYGTPWYKKSGIPAPESLEGWYKPY
ncbi:MAG: tagatose 1,6-diphosphate aldolase [Dehalococcoidia bacterium]